MQSVIMVKVSQEKILSQSVDTGTVKSYGNLLSKIYKHIQCRIWIIYIGIVLEYQSQAYHSVMIRIRAICYSYILTVVADCGSEY